ncbi:MAG: hypothetical protein ACRCW9_02685, partial [Cetobacterium sp.]
QELIAGVKLGKEKYELIKEKRALGISPSDVLAKDISKTTEGVSIKEVKGVPSGKRGITTLRIFLTIYAPFIFNVFRPFFIQKIFSSNLIRVISIFPCIY